MPDRYYCVCRHCGKQRTISTGYRTTSFDDGAAREKDLFAENDCACRRPSAALVPSPCSDCGETGRHWLGCPYIGLPEIPDDAKPAVH